MFHFRKEVLSSVMRNREAPKEDVHVSLRHRTRCRWTWHGPCELLWIPGHCCGDLWKHATGALKPPDTSVVSFTFGPGSQVKHCRDISCLCSCISSFYFQVPISLNICTLRIPDMWPKPPVAPGTGSSNSTPKKVPHYWCVCVCVFPIHVSLRDGKGQWFADVDRCRVMTPRSRYGSLIMREV